MRVSLLITCVVDQFYPQVGEAVVQLFTNLGVEVRFNDRFSEAESAPKNMTCITGPSRTADIEQTITMGVHGPRSLHLVIL